MLPKIWLKQDPPVMPFHILEAYTLGPLKNNESSKMHVDTCCSYITTCNTNVICYGNIIMLCYTIVIM